MVNLHRLRHTMHALYIANWLKFILRVHREDLREILKLSILVYLLYFNFWNGF